MLLIVGSRREGNSYNLAKYIKENLESKRIYCDIITPGNQNIHLCTGCMDCDKNGICDFNDDMKQNIDKIINEKTIMFITPTRWNLLSGDLKIFIDRLNPLYSKDALKGKNVILVSIASKGKELYSSAAALDSLVSFSESAKMNIALKEEFNDCLVATDILNQTDKMNALVNNIIKILDK